MPKGIIGDLDQLLGDALNAYRSLGDRDEEEDKLWIAAVTAIAHVLHRRAVRLAGQNADRLVMEPERMALLREMTKDLDRQDAELAP